MSFAILLAFGLVAAEGPVGELTVQWENASPGRPWLREVRIVPVRGGEVVLEKIPPQEGMPNGVRVRVPQEKVLPPGTGAGPAKSVPGQAAFGVELADDYGFTLSAPLLRREPFVWLKDLGIFVCAEGDFLAHRAKREALAAEVATAGKRPFRSTSEKYFEFTGYDEARPRQDDRAFEFAYRTVRSPGPRVGDAIRTMPEASYQYFCDRVPDVKHHRMFLGWPNVCQEFYVTSNGSLGTSSGSALGTGHAPAEDLVVHFGAGNPAAFREPGDRSVSQGIEDGCLPICHTRWRQGENDLHLTALAYPLVGEEVRTGNEPLAAFVRFGSGLRAKAPHPQPLSREGERGVGKEPLTRPGSHGPLWLKIKADHFGAGKPRPLGGLAGARIEDGCLLAQGRIVLACDRAAMSIASGTADQVLVRIEVQAGEADLLIPYVAVDRKLVEAGRKLGFAGALAAAKQYWNARLAKGTVISLPDPVVVHQFKTLYPRTLITGDLDAQGDYALKTSPLIYEHVWLHATAYGIEGLARRGYFEEARQYLEAGFRWQGSQASEAAKTYTDWKGFFTAPPRYTALLWLNYHGWFQWAAARYYLFSDDRVWLDGKLPALIKSLEWTAGQRRLSMRDNPDGSRPIHYGWLPPGRVTDGSAGTSTFTDCVNWMGFQEVVRALERIGHPRAGEFRQVADDYRRSIVRGLRLAARQREPVRLNDGTFIPYVPGYLESEGHEEKMWYAAVVDGGLEGLVQSGVVPPYDPLENWALANLEDNLFVMAPNLADEGHFVGHAACYLRRDQPEHAIYTFYSLLATQSDRQTLTTFEHRSWGQGRVYDLSPWPMHYYGSTLLSMLCHDEGDELTYCRATPRAWLAPGQEIRVERLQTCYGPTSFRLTAEADRVRAVVDLPTRYRPKAVSLRIRTPRRLAAVRVDGKSVGFDPATGTIRLPTEKERVEVEARW